MEDGSVTITSATLGYPVKIAVATECEPSHRKLSKKGGRDVVETVKQRWMQAECTNASDGKVYHLALQQSSKLDKVIPQTFGYVLRLYPCHPESKSFAPDGTPCSASTRGLLQRASIIAGTPHYVGKEADRRWEQGEDLSLVRFTPVEYSPVGKMIAADVQLLNEMAKHPLREMMRTTGLSQHTLEAIRRGQSVRARTLTILKLALRNR